MMHPGTASAQHVLGHYQHSMNQAVLGPLQRVQMLQGGPVLTSSQTWDQCTVSLQWSSQGPFRWGVHNGEVSLTEGWVNVAWRREFPAHFLFWLPHHIQLLNSLLCDINLFLPPHHHGCIAVYASHIKPKVSLGLGAGRMQKHHCVDPGNMCQTLVWSVLGGPQSRDVQPVCFPSNGSLARNKALRWRFLHLADGATVDICAQRHRRQHKPRRHIHRCPRDDVSQVKPRPRQIHDELCGTIWNWTRSPKSFI